MMQSFGVYVVRADYALNKEFIAKVLCVNRSQPQMHCNGKCYLKKKLKEQENNNQDKSNHKSEKLDTQLFFYNEFIPYHCFAPAIKIWRMLLTDKLTSTDSPSIFHPPASYLRSAIS
jgi:hypothetical protein